MGIAVIVRWVSTWEGGAKDDAIVRSPVVSPESRVWKTGRKTAQVASSNRSDRLRSQDSVGVSNNNLSIW